MYKLKELGLQDLHFQIMCYVEYDKRRKLHKYTMNQLSLATSVLKESLEIQDLPRYKNEKDQIIYSWNTFPFKVGTNKLRYVGLRRNYITWIFSKIPSKKGSHSKENTNFYYHNTIFRNAWNTHSSSAFKDACQVAKYITKNNLSLKQAQQLFKYIEKREKWKLIEDVYGKFTDSDDDKNFFWLV